MLPVAVAAAAARRVCEGWDVAPLALVPHSSRDVKQLQTMMAVLRDEYGAYKKVGHGCFEDLHWNVALSSCQMS
jgi:hypothetical protein